jgi:GDSL-like Lipase/Acylhydrolase family
MSVATLCDKANESRSTRIGTAKVWRARCACAPDLLVSVLLVMSRTALTLTCGLVALLCTASLVGNLFLASALLDSFVKLHFSRVFPLGYVPDDAQLPFAIRSRESVAFWGDSRSFFWDKTALSKQWAILNFAHGAKTSSQLRLELETAPPPPVSTAYSVVQVGINDLHPLGALGPQKQQILERLRLNIVAIRDALLTRSDIVVLTTIFPPGRVPLLRRSVWDPSTLEYIRQINEVIRRAADGKRVILLDAHALLSDADSYLSVQYVDDDFFLHVNLRGYTRLNAALQQVFAQYPPRNK